MKTHNLTGLLQSDNSIKEYGNNVKWNGIDVYSQAEVSPTQAAHLKGTYITLDGTKTYGCVKDVPANTTLDASGIAEYLVDPQFPAGTKIWIDDGTGATAYTIGYGNTSVGDALDGLNSNKAGVVSDISSTSHTVNLPTTVASRKIGVILYSQASNNEGYIGILAEREGWYLTWLPSTPTNISFDSTNLTFTVSAYDRIEIIG